MADTERTESDPKGQLFDVLKNIRAGMLGVEGAGSHMRPMTHHVDRDAAILSFLTSRQTELVREIGQGATAHYTVVDDANGYYACMAGAIRQSENAAKLDEMWSAVTAAWFNGRDDPDLLLVEMDLRDAEIWSSTDSSVQFGLEIARANINDDARPDIGEHAKVTF